MSILNVKTIDAYGRAMNDHKREYILSRALEVFSRYGYRRVNMKEIAEAAGISRQGLYLYFKTKEEVYNAAVEQRAERLLEEIRQRINKKPTAKEQILNAFEIWTIRDFETEVGSPEAREIYECTQSFMSVSFDKMRLKFEAILAATLTDHYKTKKITNASVPAKVAHLIYSSVRGLKLSAKSGPELRKLIQDLLNLVLAD